MRTKPYPSLVKTIKLTGRTNEVVIPWHLNIRLS